MTNETQTTKPLEVLVIEDNESHLQDAKLEVARQVGLGNRINATYATNYVEARGALEARAYDQIVSDVFFPESKERISSPETVKACKEVLSLTNLARPKLYKEILEYVEEYLKKGWMKPEEKVGAFDVFQYQAIEKWLDGKALAPLGVLVAKEAQQRKIPVALCSSGYHHGFALQPICTYARQANIPLVDGIEFAPEDKGLHYEKEAQKKNWKAAFEGKEY